MGGHSLSWVDCEALLDEVSGCLGDVPPVFDWCERVVCLEDSLHLFQIRIAVEWGISAEEEVGDDADSPDVPVSEVSKVESYEQHDAYTGFPWPVFLKISGAI